MKTIHRDECLVCGSRRIDTLVNVTDFAYSGDMFPVVVCADCTMAMTQDAPIEEEVGKYYNFGSYISHSDAKDSLFDKLYHKVRGWMFEKKKGWIKKHSSGNRLLDIGAGTGYFASYMKNASYEVTGIEPDIGARKVAQDKLGISLLDVDKFEKLATETFDIVTMWHVLEHVYEIDSYFEKIDKVLTKGGVLFIAVPNYASYGRSLFEEHWIAWDVPKHLWHFSPSSMAALAKKKGYDIIEKYRLPYDPFYISMLSQKNKSPFLWQIIGLLKGLKISIKEMGNVDKASSILYVLKPQTSIKE